MEVGRTSEAEMPESPCKPRTPSDVHGLSASSAQVRSPQAFSLETGQPSDLAENADPRATREQNWIQAPQAEPLPAAPPDLFLKAGAIVAERASHNRASLQEIEAILSRAAKQASLLLGTEAP